MIKLPTNRLELHLCKAGGQPLVDLKRITPSNEFGVGKLLSSCAILSQAVCCCPPYLSLSSNRPIYHERVNRVRLLTLANRMQ